MQSSSQSIGTPPDIIPIYKFLFSFIDEMIPSFEMPKHNGKPVESEDIITEALMEFLDEKQEKGDAFFRFTNQSQRAHADIGVRVGRSYNSENRDLFCWIEAKRLPTPKDSKRDRREYVFVDKSTFKGNGGIDRFKRKKHAPKNSFAIMFGYIQNGKVFDWWMNVINSYIIDLAKTTPKLWNEQEILVKLETASNGCFLSRHERIDKTTIELRHFWLNCT